MIPLVSSHNFDHSKSPPQRSGQGHSTQERTQLENRLRIKKLEIREIGGRAHDLEREMTRLESEIARAHGQVRRVEGEVRNDLMDTKREEDLTKGAEQGVREVDGALRDKREKEEKIKHEVLLLKQQIETKERALQLIHEEERHLVKEKESFRREYEMEHFTAKANSEHAHEKKLEAVRFEREVEHKKAEIIHKKGDYDRIRQEILRKEEEVRSIESEIRRLG